MVDRETETRSDGGSSAGMKGRAADAAREVKDAAREAKDRTAEKVGDAASGAKKQAKAQGRELAQEGKDRARSQADEQKDRVSTGLRTMADALRRGGQDLDEDQRQYGRILNTVADRAEGASRYLDERDVDSLTREVRSFAREHTSVFMSGAFTLGMLGARFLKSSPSERSRGVLEDDRYDGTPTRSFRGSPAAVPMDEPRRMNARQPTGAGEERLGAEPERPSMREDGYA